MGTNVVELDDLPVHIIQHILSFLTAKEAVQTTLFSSSWRSAWLTQPNLAFVIKNMYIVDGPQILELARKTIQRYEESNLKIKSFTLRVDHVWRNYVVLLNELIAKSLFLGATHLNLSLSCDFVLPHNIVFGSEKLVGLSVGSCKIEIGSSEREVIRCSDLESLSFVGTNISLDALSNIISCCPSIRKLSLSHVRGIEEEEGVNRSVGLMSLHLTHLELVDVNFDALFFGGVTSRFPSLKDLTLQSYYSTGLMGISLDTLSNIISSCPSIRKLSWSKEGEEEEEEEEEGVEDVISSVGFGPMINLHSLTRLELVFVKFDTLFLVDMSSRFPSLKDLTLHTHSYYSQDKEIRISSRSLERLNFAQEKDEKRSRYKFDGLSFAQEKRVRFKFDVPSIRRFTYDSWSVIPLLSFKSTKREWESRVSITCHKNLGKLWFLRLNKFLTKLRRSKIHLSLDVFCRESFDYKAGEIQGLCSRWPWVENLAVSVWGLPTLSCYAFFDGLFQICRPMFITQCLRHGQGKNEYFLCRTLVERVGNDEKCSVQDHFMYHGLRDLEEVNVAIFNKADGGGVWRDVQLESLDDDELKEVLVPDDDDEHGLLYPEEVKVGFQLKWKR